MSAHFVFDPIVVALIAVAGVLGAALAAWFGGRRRVVLVLLQAPAALLLLAALSVRDAPATGDLVVLTPGADVSKSATASGIRVALPGAPAGEGIESVPDLATALRRFPAERLLVVGDGLRRHDRDAVGTRALRYRPSPGASTPAIVALNAPDRVRAGTWWSLQGQVAASSGTAVVLLDPAGAKAATADVGDDGRFALETVARATGPALYELQLRRGDDVLQSVPVPVVAETAPPLRVLLLAASPSPELKYLRRWALDAGIQLEARIALAPGLGQRRGAAALDAAQLAELDLLVVDERSWPQLASLQPALRDAVANGLGLMVRVTGNAGAAVADSLKAWGIALPSAPKPAEIRLASAPGLLLHAWPVAASANPVLLADARGAPLAEWHAIGRGRVAAWRLTDSHRLYTRGERERHATLWSEAWSTLARARGTAVALPVRAVVGERALLCGMPDTASIRAPDGSEAALAKAGDCAAFWPRVAGWHRLRDATTTRPFYVFDPSAVDTLLAQERRTATRALATTAATTKVVDRYDADRRRAALLAAWLATMVLAWWLERRRPAPPTPADSAAPPNRSG